MPARTPDQIVREILGAQQFTIAQLIAEKERLEAEVAELKAAAPKLHAVPATKEA